MGADEQALSRWPSIADFEAILALWALAQPVDFVTACRRQIGCLTCKNCQRDNAWNNAQSDVQAGRVRERLATLAQQVGDRRRSEPILVFERLDVAPRLIGDRRGQCRRQLFGRAQFAPPIGEPGGFVKILIVDQLAPRGTRRRSSAKPAPSALSRRRSPRILPRAGRRVSG